jgi:hypothetical protein
LVVACSKASLPCIAPPPAKLLSDRETPFLANITADLQKIGLQDGPDVKDRFASRLQGEFDTLSDPNASLFLFLEAIDCYLKNGKVGEDVARSMAGLVMTRWSAKQGLAPAPSGGLSPDERNAIAASPLRNQILGLLVTVGIE